jgi:hypothetical protein
MRDDAARLSTPERASMAGPPFDSTYSIRSELLASESRGQIRVFGREQAVSVACTYD